MVSQIESQAFGERELEDDEVRDALVALNPDNAEVEAKFEPLGATSKMVSLYGHYDGKNGEEPVDVEATITFREGRAQVLVLGTGGKIKVIHGEKIYERPDLEEIVTIAESLYQEYQRNN